MRFIKLTTDGMVSTVKLEDVNCGDLARSIGARLVQYVDIQDEAETVGDFMMICDEEGLFNAYNKCNPAASVLYGVYEHGQPIVGDVLFAKRNPSRHSDADYFLDIGEAEAGEIERSMQEMLDLMDKAGASAQLHRRFDSSEAPMPEIIFFN